MPDDIVIHRKQEPAEPTIRYGGFESLCSRCLFTYRRSRGATRRYHRENDRFSADIEVCSECFAELTDEDTC